MPRFKLSSPISRREVKKILRIMKKHELSCIVFVLPPRTNCARANRQRVKDMIKLLEEYPTLAKSYESHSTK